MKFIVWMSSTGTINSHLELLSKSITRWGAVPNGDRIHDLYIISLWVSLFWMLGVYFCFLSVTEIPQSCNLEHIWDSTRFGISKWVPIFKYWVASSRWQLLAVVKASEDPAVPSTVIEPVVAKIVTPLKQPNRTKQTQWKRKWRIKSQTFWLLTRFVQICIKRFGYIGIHSESAILDVLFDVEWKNGIHWTRSNANVCAVVCRLGTKTRYGSLQRNWHTCRETEMSKRVRLLSAPVVLPK